MYAYLIAGILFGAAIAIPIVMLVMRGKIATDDAAQATERVKAAEALARAEEAEKAASARTQNAIEERDSLTALLESARREGEDLRVELAVERGRMESAERATAQSLLEKQASCDLLIATERSAQALARENLVEAHTASLRQLNEHLDLREQEHARALEALRLAHTQMETALREGYEKEIRATEKQLTDLQEFLKLADERLSKQFGDASSIALQRASESFFELAKKRFDERDEAAKTNAEAHKKDLEQLLNPMKQELDDLEKLNRQIDKDRIESFGSLREKIDSLDKTNESLVNALKKPSVRGSWGEGQLLSILESSGWVQGQNFDVQDVTEEDGKTLRTDVVIHLPRGRKVIIDSKAPLDQYMAAMEAETEEERVRRCTEHARAVRGHVKALEKKEYWSRYAESPPYVILFLPYEAAYQIACEYDRSLLDEAHRSRIILANPMTLMNLVHLATFVLNEERLQQNAEEVRKHGKQLCERLGKVLELMATHGRHIRQAADSYNNMTASVSSRLIPASMRMRELGAGAEKPLSTPDSVDTAIRHLLAGEDTQ